MQKLFILLAIISLLRANEYNPHQYPTKGPFFEGWYSRFEDHNSNNTFGLLFGRVLAEDGKKVSDDAAPAYISILHDKGDGSPIKNYDMFPDVSAISVNLIPYAQVVDPPVDGTDVSFTWKSEPEGYFMALTDHTEFQFENQDVFIKGKLAEPTPWGPNGEGPGGWTDRLPLPLRWFVHSIDTPILQLEFKDKNSGFTHSVVKGSAHQEKNWGRQFPKAWIWLQSQSKESTFVMSGGPLDPLGVHAHLAGFRNKDLKINFHPQDSIVSKKIDACNGKFEAELSNLGYRITYQSEASYDSFTGLLGPSADGFKMMCYESYNAKAKINVYKKQLLGETLVFTDEYYNSALEFGGAFACENL